MPIRKNLSHRHSPVLERWMGWARSLSRWRRRLVACFSPAAMTLLRPRMFTQLLRAHRSVSIFQHNTQVNFFLSLMVRNRLAQDGVAGAREVLAPVISLSRLSFAGETVAPRVPSAGDTSYAPTAPALSMSRVAPRTGRTFLLWPQTTGPAIHPNFVTPRAASLETVHSLGGLVLVSRRTGAKVSDAEPPARRLRRQTKRCEQALSGRPALLTRRPAGLTDSRPASTSPAELAPGDHFSGEGPRGWRAVSQRPDMNVEALTDEVIRQIDRRIVARRERMGKM